MDAADFAQALYNITSSGIMQVSAQPLPARLQALHLSRIAEKVSAQAARGPCPVCTSIAAGRWGGMVADMRRLAFSATQEWKTTQARLQPSMLQRQEPVTRLASEGTAARLALVHANSVCVCRHLHVRGWRACRALPSI